MMQIEPQFSRVAQVELSTVNRACMHSVTRAIIFVQSTLLAPQMEVQVMCSRGMDTGWRVFQMSNVGILGHEK